MQAKVHEISWEPSLIRDSYGNPNYSIYHIYAVYNEFIPYALSDEYAENLNQCSELWYYIWASPNKNDVGSESNSEEVWENDHVKIKMDKIGQKLRWIS